MGDAATQDMSCDEFTDLPDEDQNISWARLYRITSAEIKNNSNGSMVAIPSTIDLTENKDEVKFGRNTTNDFIIELPIVSGRHCKIHRQDKDTVFLYDTSTNGTYVNDELVGKGKRTIITDGNNISLVKKTSKQEGVTFLYKVVKSKEEEDEDAPPPDYVLGKQLGSGAFATVYLGIHKSTGKKFAVKVIKKALATSQASLQAEVDILMKVDHPGIIGIEEKYETKNMLYLILELVTGGELFDSIVDNGRLSEDEARPFFKQMLEAIDYLHKQDIAHRDLKPENILIHVDADGNKSIKISDFGLSRIIGEGSFMKTICGTPQYLAPEVFDKSAGLVGYSQAVDLWSLGVILYTMLAGQRPFEDSESESIYQKIKKGKFSFPQKVWHANSTEVQELIKWMLKVNPKERCTTQDALEHNWTKGIIADDDENDNEEDEEKEKPKETEKEKEKEEKANGKTTTTTADETKKAANTTAKSKGQKRKANGDDDDAQERKPKRRKT